jgi:hypothetical protein
VSSSAEWAVVFATSTAPFIPVIDNEFVSFTHEFIVIKNEVKYCYNDFGVVFFKFGCRTFWGYFV